MIKKNKLFIISLIISLTLTFYWLFVQREVLKDNMESMALLDDYRTLNYVKYGAGIVGIGLIVSALLDMDKDTPPNFGTMAIGGVIANIGIWIPSMVQKDKLQKSIKVYNGLR